MVEENGTRRWRLVVLNTVRLAVIFVPLTLTVVWGWRYEGLNRLLGRLELWAFDSYSSLEVGFLVWILLTVPGLVLGFTVQRWLFGPDGAPPLLGRARVAPAVGGSAPRAGRLAIRRPGPLFVAAVLGAAGVLVGGGFLARSARAGSGVPPTLGAAAVGSGSASGGRYVELVGRLLLTQGVTFEESYGRNKPGLQVHYLPLVALDADGAGPLRVIVRAPAPFPYERLIQQPSPVHVRGVLHDGLAGVVRDAFTARHRVALASEVWVLDARESPDDMRAFGLAILGAFGGLGALVAVATLIHRRVVRGQAAAGDAAPSRGPGEA